MDRVALSLVRCGDGPPAEAITGGYRLDAEADWLVEGHADAVDTVRAALPAKLVERWGSTVRICFSGTVVGRISAGLLGTLHVHSGKWTEADYNTMLGEIASTAAALPFAAGAASALPYARDPFLLADDIPYHAFVWLRHALLDHPARPLLGALKAIVADPHRRLVREERVVPVELASGVSPHALDDIVAARWPFQRAPPGLGIHGVLPVRVTDVASRESIDTAENRFAKAFLEDCAHILATMRARASSAPGSLAARLTADLDAVDAALTPIRRATLWRGVGRLTQMPSASAVLQRRAPYREVLRSSVLLRAASRVLPFSEPEIVQLLEVKDVAKLYELWCGFRLLALLSDQMGAPVMVTPMNGDSYGMKVRYGLHARWATGVELAFNPSYSLTAGWHGRSRSVPLRPDFAVYVPTGRASGLHLFDAKFRRHRDADGISEARGDDLHKMHTYRDAIPQARSAWVLYPGQAHEHFLDEPDTSMPLGIGAFATLPGQPGDALAKHLTTLLDLHSSS